MNPSKRPYCFSLCRRKSVSQGPPSHVVGLLWFLERVAATPLSHSLCLDASLPFSPPSTWQTPPGPLKPSENITFFPESPRVYLLSPYPCSCGAPPGRGEKAQGTGLDREFQPSQPHVGVEEGTVSWFWVLRRAGLEPAGREKENGFGSTQRKMDRPAPGITWLRSWRRTSSRRKEKQRCRLPSTAGPALHQSRENTALLCPIPLQRLHSRTSVATLVMTS